MLLAIGMALLLPFLLLLIVNYVINFRKIASVLGKFPCDPKHWLWGNVHQHPGFNEEGLEFLRKRVMRYPRYCSFWTGRFVRGDLYIHHPEPISVLLKTAEPKPVRSGIYKYLNDWLGNGLILSSGHHWQRNRKLLTNVFHFDILKKYLVVKNKCTDIFMQNLEKYAESGESVDMYGKLSLLALDIILRCAFSLDNDVQSKGESHPYLHAVTEMAFLFSERMLNPFHHYEFIYRLTNNYKEHKRHRNFIHKISQDLLLSRKQSHELSLEKHQKDFLDILLTAKDEDGNGLTDLEIRVEVDTFLFAGHDTTSSAISWILDNLAKHPEIQKRCQDEVDELFGGRTDDEVMWEDLQKMRYLTMCIKETLRLESPAYMISRELENPILIDGIELPPGLTIIIDIYSLHHNPEVWPDPMKYDPDRFLPENIDKMHNFAFVPFSAGPRNCIGQAFAMDELKLVVARFLKRYTVSVDKSHKTRRKPALLMKTENGILLKISKRV